MSDHIQINRFHPSIERDDLLELVKSVMREKRPQAALNWKNTKTIIFVEILKSNCYIGLFTDWIPRTKYNWNEHHKRKMSHNDSESKKAKAEAEVSKQPETKVEEVKEPEVEKEIIKPSQE